MPANDSQAQKHNKQMVTMVVVIIVVAIVIFGGGSYLVTKLCAGQIRTSDYGDTTTLAVKSYTNTIEATGTVEAPKSSSVSPEVQGTVASVAVKEDDLVEKDDVLFVLENKSLADAADKAKDAYEKAVDMEAKAKSRYDKAEGKVDAAEEKLADAKEDAKQAAALAKAAAAAEAAASSDAEDDGSAAKQADSGASTEPAEFDSTAYDDAIELAKDNAEDAKDAYELAQENTKALKTSYDDAKEQVDNLTVKAPQAGTVLDLKVKKGMTAAEVNAQGAALRVVDLGKLTAVVQVREAEVSAVSKGQEATVESQAAPDTDISGTVSKVAKKPNKAEQGEETSYNVTISLATVPEAVKIGSPVKAAITLKDYGAVFYVPSTAVGQSTLGSYVEVVTDGNTTKQHTVEVLGQEGDDQLIITSNTLQGGQVILNRAS